GLQTALGVPADHAIGDRVEGDGVELLGPEHRVGLGEPGKRGAYRLALDLRLEPAEDAARDAADHEAGSGPADDPTCRAAVEVAEFQPLTGELLGADLLAVEHLR